MIVNPFAFAVFLMLLGAAGYSAWHGDYRMGLMIFFGGLSWGVVSTMKG